MISLMGLTLFTSCSKDSDISDASLVGLWVFVNMTTELENPTNVEELEIEQGFMALASVMLQGTTIEFRPDKTFIFTAFGQVERGTYSNDNGKFTLTVNDETVSEESFINSGSTISIKDGVLTLTANILDEKLRERGFTKYILKINFKK